MYLTAILSFWSHVINLDAKYKAASSRHINAFYQAKIDRATCETWRKPEIDKQFPLDEDVETLQIDRLCSPSKALYFITLLDDELEALQQQLVDIFPNLDHNAADTAKQALAKLPCISDQTYLACLEEFRDSYETPSYSLFAQHINSPTRVQQWIDCYFLESNREPEILDHYLYITEYAPQSSAKQILVALENFYQQYPDVEKTSQLLHALTSLSSTVGIFPTFVVNFGIQMLAIEREDTESFWGEVLAYFLSAYDANAYIDDIVYFLDHPLERHHYTAYAILPIAIKNIDQFPNKIVDKIILYGLFDGSFNPNFSHSVQFFDFLQMIRPQNLKQFEATIQKALQNFIADSEDFLDDAITHILPILSYLTKQHIDLKDDIKNIIEKIEFLYVEDTNEPQTIQSMDEVLENIQIDLIEQGLSNNEAELEVQQSMLMIKELFVVDENQTLTEKFAQNDLQKSETADENALDSGDILLLQLKALVL